MSRKRKTDVKVNDNSSLEALMQEAYSDACLQINEVQGAINQMVIGAPDPVDIDDITKLAKEKGNLLKVKDSAIRIKLEIAKLQSDSLKNSGDSTSTQKNSGSATLSDLKSIREIFKNTKSDADNENDSE